MTTTQPTQTTPPLAAYPKDVAASAAVLGGMGAAWLFWGSSLAASPWPLALRLLAIGGLVLAVLAVRARMRASGPSMHDPGAGGNKFWNIMVLIEIAAIAAGVFVLQRIGHPMLLICWAHLVMGLHWLPLVRFYRIGSLVISAFAAIVLALAGFAWYFATSSWPGLITGGLGGLAMMAMSAYQLMSLRRASAT